MYTRSPYIASESGKIGGDAPVLDLVFSTEPTAPVTIAIFVPDRNLLPPSGGLNFPARTVPAEDWDVALPVSSRVPETATPSQGNDPDTFATICAIAASKDPYYNGLGTCALIKLVQEEFEYVEMDWTGPEKVVCRGPTSDIVAEVPPQPIPKASVRTVVLEEQPASSECALNMDLERYRPVAFYSLSAGPGEQGVVPLQAPASVSWPHFAPGHVNPGDYHVLQSQPDCTWKLLNGKHKQLAHVISLPKLFCSVLYCIGNLGSMTVCEKVCAGSEWLGRILFECMCLFNVCPQEL